MEMNGFHSLPNVRRGSTLEQESRRLHSLSLSHIRKDSELAEYQHVKPSPFNLRWIFGYNAKVGVINLNKDGSTTAFYAAGNCGVLYNWTANQMRILQGHRHPVKFIASDKQGRWLVTADSGAENILIVWDSNDCFPQRTLFLPHKEAHLARVALSADAKYLLTLAYRDNMATIFWWIWSFGSDEPHAKLDIELPRDSVVMMDFNPYKSEQFLLMTKTEIWIGISGKKFVIERGLLKETDDYELKIKKPEIKVNSDVGRFTYFTFVKASAQVLVTTSRGNVLVFRHTIEYQKNVENADYESFRFVKVLKVERQKINVIVSVDGYIVTGNTAGEVRFYDEQMKLVYWVHGFTVDCVKGLSFNVSPRSYKIFDPLCGKLCPCWEKVTVEVDETGLPRQKLLKQKIPSDATVAGKPVVVRDFIICTQNQGVAFVDYVVEKCQTILDNKPAHALALTVHPEKPFVCIGYADGRVDLFNYTEHRLFVRTDLRDRYKVVTPPRDDSIHGDYEITVPELAVTCLKYSPSGLHLACGLNTGQLIFLDPTTIGVLTDQPFRDSSHPIKEINYCCDSLTMACSDTGRTICVYKYDCQTFKWNFVGKHRSHYKEVTALFFLPEKNADGEFKLLSLGADRIMVEYDIGASSDEYLEIASLDRMEQTAVPLAGIVWPAPDGLDPERCHTSLPTILVANDEYKYKIINYATTMTMATVLGPRYEHPVSRVQLVTRRGADADEGAHFLLFATKNVVGLQKMPLDGNPWKHVGLLGHPLEITEMCFREDSGTLFTIGSKDSCMYQWAANYRSAETTTKLGGGDLDPYYCLIENGRPGWLFQEIRDLFYYIQVLCQGTFSPAVRRVKDCIPIDSLPDLMRALGFFPTEYEVENLIVEAKYKVYQKQPCSEMDFEDFVKLYLNHRPAFGDNFKRLRAAFRTFAAFNNDSYIIDRDDFLDVLAEYGECFTRPLSWYLLSILSGQSFEDRANMAEDDFSFLPEEISFSDLVTNIIGIQDMDNLSEQYSGKESLGSQLTGSSAGGDSEDKLY